MAEENDQKYDQKWSTKVVDTKEFKFQLIGLIGHGVAHVDKWETIPSISEGVGNDPKLSLKAK